jgi:predicted phosphodiesterase
MSKIVVLGDAHATSRTWPRLEVYGDTFLAIREIADAARAEGATLVATGDLLHSGIAADTPRCLEEILQATHGLGDIVYAVGNHDRTGAPGGERNPEWVDAVLNRHYVVSDPAGDYAVGDTWWRDEGRVLTVGGVRYAIIHHQPTAAAFEERFRALERGGDGPFDVLVCHQGMDKTLWHRDAHEIVVAELAPRLAGLGCRLCLCGHYHGRGQWEEAGVVFISPGAVVPPLRGESPDPVPAYPVVDLPESGPVRTEWREIVNRREIVRLSAVDAAGREAAIKALTELVARAGESRLPPAIARPVFSLTYRPEPGFRQTLEGIAGDRAHLDLTPLAVAAAPAGEEEERTEELRMGRLLADIDRITAVHLPPGPARDALRAIQRGDNLTDVIEAELARLESAAS